MGFFDEFIEKIAADFDINREKELIRQVQQNNDPAAWRKLRMVFRPVISKSVVLSKANFPGVPKQILESAALEEFERSVLNYDETMGSKPSTYLINNMKLNLKKVNKETMSETRMPSNLADQDTPVFLAETQLQRQLDRDPTIEEIHRTLKTDFNKNIPLKQIERIKNYRRDEFSGNVVVGKENEGENITYGDILNTSTFSGEDFLQAQKEKEKLNLALQKLTPQERKLIMEYRGIGEYANKPKMTYPALAFNNNLKDAWQAQKMIKDIEKKLESELR